MFKEKLKKFIGKKSTGVIVSILTFGVIFGAIFSCSNVTYAADSLPGIVDIRNNISSSDTPYNILEIVPDKDSAEIGFLIGGEEPLYFDTTSNTWMDWRTYLAGHTEDRTPDQRKAFVDGLYTANTTYIGVSSSDAKPLWYQDYQEVAEGTAGANVIYGGYTQSHGILIPNVVGGSGSDFITGLGGWNPKFTATEGNYTYDSLVNSLKPYYVVRYVEPITDQAKLDALAASPTKSTYYLYTVDSSYAGTDTKYVYSCTVAELKALNDANLADGDDTNNIDLTEYCLLQMSELLTTDYGSGIYPVVYEVNDSDFTAMDTEAPYALNDTAVDTKGHTILTPNHNIYYTGGFNSNEWFKQYVMDIDADDCVNYHIDVTVATPDEINIMSDVELDKFDFIYINAGTSQHGSGTFNYVAGDSLKDLTQDAVKKIFERICNNKIPCIADYAIVANGYTLGQSNSMIYALSCMLLQDDYRGILEADNTLDITKITPGHANSKVSEWHTNISSVSINSYNYVNENVMVINTTDMSNKLTDNFHTTPYTSSVVSLAYQDVLDEIITENLYRTSDQTSGYLPLDDDIYKSSVVRYIINFTGARVVVNKTSVNVLEIQPGMVAHKNNSSTDTDGNELTPAKIRKWLGVGDSVAVNIKTVTTNEFVGRIEDINSEYDLIYIGADIYKLNNNGTNTVYRDTSMNGMIYTNIGDMKRVKAHFAGQLDTDYIAGTNRTKIYNEIEARYNGNDISADKHNDLVDYVLGTYPIVVADKLCVSDTAPSSTTIDNCTYLYSFLDEHLDKPNVFRVSEVSAGNNAEFKFYANRGKLNIGTKVLASEESSVTSGTAFVVPGVIDSTDSTAGHVTYISKENGKFYLKYKFTITNNGAVFDNTKYTAALYLDSNADGKFSKEYEKIPDITVTHVATGKNIANGQLVAGEQYILSRQVPDSYSGLLTWKVEVTQSTNEYIRDSVTGYTKLYDPDRQAVTIKVLHVHKDAGQYLNLETGIGNGPNNNGTQSILSTLVWGGNYGGTYYDGIDDEYKFEFTSIPNKAFNKSYETGYLYRVDGNGNLYSTGQKFNLMDYDMFVLGFYDSYSVRGTSSQDISAQAINGTNGIKEFIDRGKSVLFAHDTTSFTAIEDYSKVYVDVGGGNWKTAYTSPYNCAVWAYTLNKNIRDMVGLDAYGVSIDTKDGIDYSRIHSGVPLKSTDGDTTLMDALTNTLDAEGHYTIGLKSLAYKPGSGKTETVPETQGLTYNWMQMWPSTISSNTAVYRTGTGRYKEVKEADKVNEGQITTYPYYLPDTITTATTHSQYFTLDLMADDDGDNETDLVVWYTLGGDNQYDYSPKDVVNNYYIYNKGNITYTGIGHSHNTTTVQEGMLFINTMVAAYNSSTKDPEVMFYDSENSVTPTESYYEYGDVDNDVAFRDNEQKMYFSINDTNIIRGTKTAAAEYYVALKKSVSDLIAPSTNHFIIGDTTYSLYKDSEGRAYIKLTDLKTYATDGTQVDASNLQCGVMYYVNIPTSVFDMSNVSGENVNTFMVSAKTTLKKKGTLTGKEFIIETSTTYSTVDFVHVELFPLD